jgi:hypothetical protein
LFEIWFLALWFRRDHKFLYTVLHKIYFIPASTVRSSWKRNVKQHYKVTCHIKS